MSKASEIVLQVDGHVVKLEKLQALIDNISNYFDEKVEPNSIEAMALANSAEHISLLISLALDVLGQEIKGLSGIVNDALATERAETPAVLEGGIQ